MSLTNVCFVSLQTVNRQERELFLGTGLPPNHFAVKQPGAEIRWLLFFSFARFLITRLALHSGGRRRLEMYPWRCFAWFSMLVLDFSSSVSGQIMCH